MQSNGTGQFIDQPQAVTYIYKKDAVEGGDKSISTITGNSIDDSTKITNSNKGDGEKKEERS